MEEINETDLNARDYIEKLLTKDKNVKVTDAGVGIGFSDLGITIDGFPFNIRITPRESG